MASAAGIFNQSTMSAQPLTRAGASSMADSSTGSSSASSPDSSSATISANDFLTLLVTEMKNQDPTATTDPNEYINQLVNVNSLEQLININQTLTTAFGDTSSSSSTTGSGQASQATTDSVAATPAAATNRAASAGNSTVQSGSSTVQALASRFAPGNLGVPATNPAAQRLAQALDGRSGTQSIGAALAAR